MQKPTGYDEARETGNFTPVNLGGHYAVIKQVSERQSSTGKDMIVVLFDFAKEDSQPGYFTDLYNSSDRNGQEKKWPFAGSKYIMVKDYSDPSKTSSAFKTFCSCAERSNNFEIAWGGNNWAAQFKGKKIGVVFGEEESEYNGEIKMRRNPRWFCTYDKVPSQNTPNPKYLNGSTPAANAAPPKPVEDANGFLGIPEGAEEEIPF